MDVLLSVLVVTGLIVVIMRFVSAGKARHLPEGIDPVCGMTVAANEGFLAGHEGVEYRFCSLRCLENFERSAPEHGRRAA